MAGVLEEMGVDVERDGDAGMPEDAADLGDVETEVDYQMARERVTSDNRRFRSPQESSAPGRRPRDYRNSSVGLSLVLLMIKFRSIVVPIKAAIGFLLSIGASLGAVVAVFQWGWAHTLVGAASTGPVISFCRSS